MTTQGQSHHHPGTVRRVVAALPRRAVGASAQLIYYATVLAVIYRVYAGDFSALPLLTASPILARLIEAIGGNLLSSVLERVARDDELGPEEILARIETALEGMGDEMRVALTSNTEVLTLIYRLLAGAAGPLGGMPEEIAALADLARPAAVAIPRTPHLLKRIGREDEMRQALSLLSRIDAGNKGQTVFLMGPLGSGRAAFAEEVRVAAATRGFRTASVRFAPSEAQAAREMEDHLRLGRRPGHVEAIFETFPTMAKQAVHRQWTDLMIQLSEAGAAAGADDNVDALGRYVRSAARVGPLVITLDNLDWAPGYWIDLLPRLAREIALDLPVLLLISLESPAPLDKLHGPLHTEATRLAQKLAAEGTAASHYFGPVTYDDIARAIHPAMGELAARLHYMSGGDPKTAEIIWLEWVAQGAVTLDDAGRRQVADPDARWWVFGDAADHARELLAQALDGWEDEPPFTLEGTEAILSCAALEGETFTVRAVAQVLQMDADELADFLDTYLLPYEDPDEPGDAQPGILEEAGFAPVDHFRQLFQYRFTRPYLHHVWAKYPAAPERLEEWRRALPLALEGLYYPYGFRIAGNLARLFAEAGMADKAGEYRHFGRRQQSLEELRAYIRPMLDTVPESKYDAYRLFDAGFAFLNKLFAQRSDLWLEGYAMARRLGALARCHDDWEYEAEAERLMAWTLELGGKPWRGLFWVRRGNSLLTRNGMTHLIGLNFTHADLAVFDGLSSARRQDQIHLAAFDDTTGILLQAMGDLAAARPYLERALAISERVLGPDHPDTATSLSNLGFLLQATGDLAAARPYLEQALAIRERVLGPEHPDTATSLNNMGFLLQAMGDPAAARPYLERALAINERVLGPDHPDTANSLNNLGFLLQATGDWPAARPYLERALAIRERVLGPEHPDTANSLNNLGFLLQATGDWAAARPYLERALAIRERVLGPEHPDTAQSLNNLGTLCYYEGNFQRAADYVRRALAVIEKTLGPDHSNTVQSRDNLAAIEARLREA